MRLKIFLGIGFILVIYFFFSSTENSQHNKIDYNHVPNLNQVYGDLEGDIKHLLARDEDHVHPNESESQFIDKATKKIKEAQLKDPSSFILAKDLIHINYSHNAKIAIEECQRMLSLNPNDDFMLMHLAHLQALKKEYKNAIINATKLLGIKDSDESHYVLGYCYYHLGQNKKAKIEFEKISKNSAIYHEVGPLLIKVNALLKN
jgi:tetratricopeptide (TPR) repeat protein